MNSEQFAAATVDTYELRSVTVIQVDNGYKLQGQRRFLNNATGIAQVQVDREAVAADNATATGCFKSFIDTGSFLPAPKG